MGWAHRFEFNFMSKSPQQTQLYVCIWSFEASWMGCWSNVTSDGKWTLKTWNSVILEFKKREFILSPTISAYMSSQSFIALPVFLTQGSFYAFSTIYCYSFCIREPYFYCWIAPFRLSNGLNPQHLFLSSKEKGLWELWLLSNTILSSTFSPAHVKNYLWKWKYDLKRHCLIS